MNRCSTPYCKNKVPGNYQCNKCRSKKWREANPIKYSFYNLRNRARRDNIPFTIVFEDFEKWCVNVHYIGMKRGRGANARTVDRRYNDIGYHIDNIQVMEKRDNVIKYFSYDFRVKKAFVYEIPASNELPEPELKGGGGFLM